MFIYHRTSCLIRYGIVIFISYLFAKLIMSYSPIIIANPIALSAMPFLCIFILLLFLKPKITLLVLLFIRPLLDPLLNYTKISLSGASIGVGGIINLCVLVLALVLIFNNRNKFHESFLSNITFNKAFIIYLSITAVSIMLSLEKGNALKLWFNLLSYYCMFIIPSFFITEQRHKIFWLRVLFLSSLPAVIYANFNFVTGGRYYLDAGYRIAGSFTHPNILAFYLVFIFILGFYMLKSKLVINKYRSIMIVYLIDVVLLLIATKTRSAWISLWVFFFIWSIMREKKYIILCVALPLLLLINPNTSVRLADVYYGSAGNHKENSFSWRMDLWRNSLPLIKKNFVQGNGLGSFKPLSENFYKQRGTARAASHNTFLEVLFENGIVGLISFAALFWFLLKMTLKKNTEELLASRTRIVLSIYIICYLLAAFSDNMLYYLAFNWNFWYLYGIILSPTSSSKNVK